MAAVPERRLVAVSADALWLDPLELSLKGIGVELVGKAASLPAALALVARWRPDVVLGDLDLPGERLDTLEFLNRVRALVPGLRVIVVSDFDDPGRVNSAFDGGAFAYVVKTARPEDFAFAVRQAFEHAVYIAVRPGPLVETREPTGRGPLTPREQEILRLVAQGSSNGEVARSLCVTEQTVKFHLANIYRKLSVKNRTQAGRWAHEHGLLAEPSPQGAGV